MLVFDSSLKLIYVLKAVFLWHHRAPHIPPAAQFSILIQHACILHYWYSIQQVHFKPSWLHGEAHEIKIIKRRFNEPCFSHGLCDTGLGLLVLHRMPDLCHSDRRAVWLQAQPASLSKILPAPAVLRPCILALRLSEGLCCQKLPETNTEHHGREALAQGLSTWPPQSSQTLLNSTGWPRVENWAQDPE